MPKKESPLNWKNSIIVYLAYKIFDLLRYISVFDFIGRIYTLWWKCRFKRSHPLSSPEDVDSALFAAKLKARETNRPLVFGYLFPEIWVLCDVLFAIIGCIVLRSCAIWVCWVFFIWALLRSFEMFVYQMNVLLFDPIKNGGARYEIKSATRMIIMLLINIAEYIMWFSVMYLFIYRINGLELPKSMIVSKSFLTFTNIASPNEVNSHGIAIIAYLESIVGLFMNIVCIARFISLLPPVKTIDEH